MVMVELRDCVDLVTDSILPGHDEKMPYIGLEHIGRGKLQLVGHGYARDITSPKTRFRKGDILFGKLRPYFRKVIKAPFCGICSTDIWVVRAKEGVNQEYMRYCMSSKEFIDYAVAGSEGTRMPRAKWEFVSRYRIRCPSLTEQAAIAHALCTFDDKIELNRRMNEAVEEIARAIFRDWFVDFGPTRTKAAGKQPYLAPEIWDLFPDAIDAEGKPVGWRFRGLDEIAEFLNGLALQNFPASGVDDSLPVIKISELRDGVTDKSNRASVEIPDQYVVKDGDFLFSWSGSLLAKFWTQGRGALNQHLFKVTSDRYPTWFVSQWIYYYLGDFREIAASKATTMGHIRRGHLSEAITCCPPDNVLAILGRTIEPFVERAIRSEVESRTLGQVRDFLLPKLMTGEIEI